MSKQFKIKDIAALAGVSAGTVDRVIHNRGKVSESKRVAVEKILEEVGYRSNIHASAISLKKEFRIIIATPAPHPGEYWGDIHEGFRHALQEYSDIKIVCSYHTFNQFDIYSCRKAFDNALKEEADAAILGPIFIEESIEMCQRLDERNIPYVFVNSYIEDTSPVGSYLLDQYMCGQIVGKLLNMTTPDNSTLAVFETYRKGNQGVQNNIDRQRGFEDYMKRIGNGNRIKRAELSILEPKQNETLVMDFIRNNPDVRGIAIMNSRAHIIADILKKNDIRNISFVGFDLTSANKELLEEGYISFLLCQRPELQGFRAIEHMIEYMLYKKMGKKDEGLLPIDIVMKENLSYYKAIQNFK